MKTPWKVQFIHRTLDNDSIATITLSEPGECSSNSYVPSPLVGLLIGALVGLLVMKLL